MFHRPLILLQIVQLILFIVDSGCTKHMTGNLKLLCNFVEKYLGTVHFGNDQFAPILGYGDLVQGNITIKRVYYVKGLNYNLFSVGQFCDADLENRSLIITIHEKTPYHIINGRKPSLKHLHIFGCTGYITRDGENLDKMKEKRDPCILVRYSTQSKGYRVYNKRTRLIVESIHINFDEIKELSKTSDYDNSGPVPQLQKTSNHNCSELEIQDHNNEPSSSKLVPNVSPPADINASSLQELDKRRILQKMEDFEDFKRSSYEDRRYQKIKRLTSQLVSEPRGSRSRILQGFGDEFRRKEGKKIVLAAWSTRWRQQQGRISTAGYEVSTASFILSTAYEYLVLFYCQLYVYTASLIFKAKRSSLKTKAVPSSKGRLNLLHMDLCSPMRVESINGKKYILVIVDDYFRYTWTLILQSKGCETPRMLNEFLKMISTQSSLLRDGTAHQHLLLEHTNRTAVAKDKTMLLVEAARTMLSASKLPLFFWAEVITTACYTQNRSIIIPTYEKTVYHIINDRKPSIRHLHIFGCNCYLTRDGENLDKMKEKGNLCILVGYSTQSKGYRFYNKRTRLIVESIHRRFDEIKEMSETSVANNTLGLVLQ
ncbi:retrovirus-related pol polyprotein from transposon TNT 1-94 [Tanacetum coccineum]